MSEDTIRLALLFGGPSGEHEVSRRSAASILANLDRQRYQVVPINIGRDGYWQCAADNPELFGESAEDVLSWMDQTGTGPARFPPVSAPGWKPWVRPTSRFPRCTDLMVRRAHCRHC